MQLTTIHIVRRQSILVHILFYFWIFIFFIFFLNSPGFAYSQCSVVLSGIYGLCRSTEHRLHLDHTLNATVYWLLFLATRTIPLHISFPFRSQFRSMQCKPQYLYTNVWIVNADVCDNSVCFVWTWWVCAMTTNQRKRMKYVLVFLWFLVFKNEVI